MKLITQYSGKLTTNNLMGNLLSYPCCLVTVKRDLLRSIMTTILLLNFVVSMNFMVSDESVLFHYKRMSQN